jgi:hypothetical protein
MIAEITIHAILGVVLFSTDESDPRQRRQSQMDR